MGSFFIVCDFIICNYSESNSIRIRGSVTYVSLIDSLLTPIVESTYLNKMHSVKYVS